MKQGSTWEERLARRHQQLLEDIVSDLEHWRWRAATTPPPMLGTRARGCWDQGRCELEGIDPAVLDRALQEHERSPSRYAQVLRRIIANGAAQ